MLTLKLGSECGFEEKETRVFAIVLAHTLALFQYPEPGSNRHSIAATGV